MKATLSPVARHRLIAYPDEPPHVCRPYAAAACSMYTTCVNYAIAVLLSLPKRSRAQVHINIVYRSRYTRARLIHSDKYGTAGGGGVFVFGRRKTCDLQRVGSKGCPVAGAWTRVKAHRRHRGTALYCTRASGNLNARDDSSNPHGYNVHLIFT